MGLMRLRRMTCGGTVLSGLHHFPGGWRPRLMRELVLANGATFIKSDDFRFLKVL
jgi:hypothetical protein